MLSQVIRGEQQHIVNAYPAVLQLNIQPHKAKLAAEGVKRRIAHSQLMLQQRFRCFQQEVFQERALAVIYKAGLELLQLQAAFFLKGELPDIARYRIIGVHQVIRHQEQVSYIHMGIIHPVRLGRLLVVVHLVAYVLQLYIRSNDPPPERINDLCHFRHHLRHLYRAAFAHYH